MQITELYERVARKIGCATLRITGELRRASFVESGLEGLEARQKGYSHGR